MSYKNELKFIVTTEETHGYDMTVKKKAHSYPSFMSAMRDRVNEKKMELGHYISTELSGYITTQYLAVVDCDSCTARDEAAAYLDKKKIAYAVFLSSYLYDAASNRYWIVCDKIGNHKNMAEFIKAVPGVDPKFALCCKEAGIINLRAYPRNFSPPIFVCRNDHDITPSNDFAKWINHFKAYWCSEDMMDLLRQMVLIHDAKPHIAAMGCHLPYEWIKGIRELLYDPFLPKLQVRNCLHGMEVGDEDED